MCTKQETNDCIVSEINLCWILELVHMPVSRPGRNHLQTDQNCWSVEWACACIIAIQTEVLPKELCLCCAVLQDSRDTNEAVDAG